VWQALPGTVLKSSLKEDSGLHVGNPVMSMSNVPQIFFNQTVIMVLGLMPFCSMVLATFYI
jgi:hypothetical protein